MKEFRLNTVNGDGSAVADDVRIQYYLINQDTGKPFVDDDGNPRSVITLKPIAPKKYRQVVAHNTERIPARKGEPPREETDWDAVQDDLVTFAVESWIGMRGADNEPLQCVLEAKLALPGDVKNAIVERALKGEAVEVAAASFRQSA